MADTQPSGNYLSKALDSLKSVHIEIKTKVPGQDVLVAEMLQDAVQIDQPKVLAIADVLSHISTFTQLSMDNVSGMNYGTRYGVVSKQFAAARGILQQYGEHRSETSPGGVKVTAREKLEELVMRTGGTPQRRIVKAIDAFLEVSADAKESYDRSKGIENAWDNFKLSLNEAEQWTYDVMAQQKLVMDNAQTDAIAKMDAYTTLEAKTDKEDPAQMQTLTAARQERDAEALTFKKEQDIYRTLKKIAESFTQAYALGTAFIEDIKQTSDALKDLWETGVITMQTNQFIYPLMAANLTQKLVLDELTRTQNALKEGINKGIETLTGQVSVNEAAVKAAHSEIVDPEVYKGYVDALLEYQRKVQPLIDECEKRKTEAIKVMTSDRDRLQNGLLEIRLDYIANKKAADQPAIANPSPN